MNFKQFFLLQENDLARTTEITQEQFKQLFEENCTQYKPSTQKLVRGMFAEGGMRFGDPRHKERPSKNTASHTMWILESLPEWGDLPKRSRSFICTTDQAYSGCYGSPYYVIPYDNAKMAICPAADFFQCFPKMSCVTTLNHTIQLLLGIFHTAETRSRILTDKEAFLQIWNDFKNYNYTLADAMRDNTRGQAQYLLHKLANSLPTDDIEITEALHKGFVQALEKFTYIPFTEYAVEDFPSRETWLSHPCLFLKVGTSGIAKDDLQDALNNNYPYDF